MKIAIYGNEVKEEYIPVYQRIFQFFKSQSVGYVLYSVVKDELLSKFNIHVENVSVFTHDLDDYKDINLVLSIGGDGTFLSAVSYVVERKIPVAGINCGRLGFLADISSENLEHNLKQFIDGDFEIENRSLIQIVQPNELFSRFNYAINELTVHKLDNSSMIKIETFINGEFLANYWADGLIVSTPTGSTAYSLSVGGPIVVPDLSGFVISPIASHNLNVRPVVVPDDVEIELRVKGRGQQYLISFDHRSKPLDFSETIKIRKAANCVPVVKLHGQSFYCTLRNKMMWGIDRRNRD